MSTSLLDSENKKLLKTDLKNSKKTEFVPFGTYILAHVLPKSYIFVLFKCSDEDRKNDDF